MGMMNPMMMGSMGSESGPPEPRTHPPPPSRADVDVDVLSELIYGHGGVFVVGYPYGGMGMGMMGSKSDSTTQGLDSTRAKRGKG
jgi:hypothetical protein